MDISKNCSRKQNLIFLFKKEKKEKENKNSSWRKNIDEKVSMYHRDKVSRNIVYKLYMCAHIGQTWTIYGHDTMNYLFIDVVDRRNAWNKSVTSKRCFTWFIRQDVKTLSRFANRG